MCVVYSDPEEDRCVVDMLLVFNQVATVVKAF